jgi:hypothetical protein
VNSSPGIDAVLALGIPHLFVCLLDVLGQTVRAGKRRVTAWALFVPESMHLFHMGRHVLDQLTRVVTVGALDFLGLSVLVVLVVSHLGIISGAKEAETTMPANLAFWDGIHQYFYNFSIFFPSFF